MKRHAATSVLVAIAIICAIVPLPPQLVERVYSRTIYPPVQRWLTTGTNMVPIALLDIAIVAVLFALVWLLVVRTRQAGLRRAAGRTFVTLLRFAAAVYLAFLALWGLNYRRVPLEQKLDYDRARITRESVVGFANRAVARINSGHALAHASPVNLTGLEHVFAGAELQLGSRARFTEPGIPKRSLLTLYFRRAAIDGMTDPWFLEIIVNPDVLDVERPMVVAHEWAHLAGYANESDANFLAWLTCVRGDPLAQYSGWFSAYEHAMRALPRQDRSAVQPLAPGPLEDLRANRVPEGIGSYDAVLRLMVGTRFDAEWKPVVR